MNRTGEIVLIVLGALVYGFFAVAGGAMIWLSNHEAAFNDAKDEMQQQPGVKPEDLDVAFEGFQSGGWLLITLTGLSVLLGILSIVFLKGNKKPKAAGIILIVAAAVTTLITLGSLIFAGIFYLIAGIMSLARKAPHPAMPAK